MFAKTIASIAALTALANAQVAPGFPVTAPQSLQLTFLNNNTVSPPGELIPRPDTAQPPQIRVSSWFSNESGPGHGVLLVVDLDVPRNGTRVQLVHQIASNVTLGSSSSSNNSVLNVPVGEVPYLQPSPPVGDSPHSYTFIIFQQPANFSIPAQYANLAQSRVPFNTSQFVRDAGLTSPFAANYIRVQNLTGTPTTTFPPARSPTSSGAASSSPAAFPGAAGKSVDGGVMGWLGLCMAALVGVAALGL